MAAQNHSNAGPSHRHVEVGVALGMVAFGALVIAGSLQVGINWGAEGPRAGFFPFYLGIIIIASSLINLWNAIRPETEDRVFAEWGQLRQVLSVVIPATFYVGFLPYIGIYLSSAILIAFFMRWLGRYPWAMVGSIAIGVPLIAYVVFEKWFLVPLPKGPLEELLGL
jgi:putative tricarboxylic transport membrane protein